MACLICEANKCVTLEVCRNHIRDVLNAVTRAQELTVEVGKLMQENERLRERLEQAERAGRR